MSSKRLKWYLALCAAGVGSAAAAVAYATRRVMYNALPTVEGQKTVCGLHKPVEVLRDAWGVPHIYAQNEEDLFFAQGYVQAQDRLFQMDAYRRVGYGRLSEITGSMGLASDRLARICGWHLAAEAQWRGIERDAETRAIADAFAQGVNAFVESAVLPAEYRLLVCTPDPWHPRDSSAWGAVLAWGLSVNWQTELLRMRLIDELGPERATDLTPTGDEEYHTIFPGSEIGSRLSKALIKAYQEAAETLPVGRVPGGAGAGSNNWVVDGTWTRSGRPMLANDPHLPPIFPTLWYENHLVGGRYNVSGFTSPGVPGVIIGHNERVAWGVTNAYPDIQDLYVERFHEEDPLLYEVDGRWQRATEREEVIHVRGRRKPLVEHIRQTHHGPVISDLLAREERALALRWTCHEENNHLSAILGMCRASDWNEFREATRAWGFPSQNVVYADVDGNIGYLMPGRVPLRGKGDGLTPSPGWRSEYEWQGWIDHEELPALFNPEPGYVVTANNCVAGDDYPYLLTGEWLAPYRARRISQLIEELAPLDRQKQARIQNDTVSLPAQRFVQLALEALDIGVAKALSRTAQWAVERLQLWDGDMQAGEVAPSLAFAWQVCFLRAALTQALGADLSAEILDENGLDEIPTQPFHDIAYELSLRWLKERPPRWVGPVAPMLTTALENAVGELRRELGPDPSSWLWGRLHYVELQSHVARIPGVGRLWKPRTYPLSGDSFSVAQARVPSHLPPSAAHVIASCRMILDVGAWDESISTLPGGQSGHPASDHYQDSVEDWLKGKYHPMLYSRSRVEDATEGRLVLNPARATTEPAS